MVLKTPPPKIQTTGPQIPNYMLQIIAFTTKNTKWRVRKCPKIPNMWSWNQQQNPNSCLQITNTVLMWHFKVLYNAHPCSREILVLGVSSLCVEQSAYNRSVRHLVPLDNGAVRLAFGHNLVTAFRRLCHRSVGPALLWDPDITLFPIMVKPTLSIQQSRQIDPKVTKCSRWGIAMSSNHQQCLLKVQFYFQKRNNFFVSSIL